MWVKAYEHITMNDLTENHTKKIKKYITVYLTVYLFVINLFNNKKHIYSVY